ncbi:chord-domain-containing protein [Blastocladiella britannica]|nr:chord-domain-containing protein [Blastocladiella britannica]
MVRCTHKGCGKDFDASANAADACTFHPGAPVFHEGLKGWSCCPKRVTDFNAFLNIPGCASGPHSDIEPAPAPVAAVEIDHASSKPAAATVAAKKPNPDANVSTFSPSIDAAAAPIPTPTSSSSAQPAVAALPERDPVDAVVAPGTACLRRACGIRYESDAVTRGTPCTHHPGAPIFHEGSKGWSCCSRKVLEFDQFLKIPGCTTGEHVFVKPVVTNEDDRGSLTTAASPPVRKDWYQSRDQVIVSLFVKKCDKLHSRVEFLDREVRATLRLPDGSTTITAFATFLPIDPARSSFEVLGSKVEVVLQKCDGISWPSLEAREGEVPVSQWTTFGATGSRVGTVGGKEIDYAGDVLIPVSK